MPIFVRPLFQRIIQNLCANPPVSVSLVGGPLLGKSTILANVAGILTAADGRAFPVVQINCAQVHPATSPPAAPTAGERWVVLLDNFDGMARWSDGDRNQWIDWITSARSERGLLLASRRPLYEIDANFDALVPTVQQNFLGLIDGEESARVVAGALTGLPDREQLAASLVEWCGGHPFLLDQVGELLLDVAGMLPAGQALGTAHLPLLRMRMAAAYAQLLFDRQWRTVQCNDDPSERPLAGLLGQLLRRGLRFDELTPAQAAPMNWLLVQGLVGIDNHSYRLFSPLLQEFLAIKLAIAPTVTRAVEPDQGAVHALVERETHRFTPQEKNLLLYFLDRPGVIISVDELLAEVWQRPDGSVRRVQEGIRRLRHRLTEFNGRIGAIDNEWGQGYRYVPVN